MIKFCPKCQTETERNANGQCRPCKQAQQAAYRVANPDKLKARAAISNALHSEKRKAYGVSWRSANKERIKNRNAAWRLANPEKHKENIIAWRASNKEKSKKTASAYRLLHKKRLNENLSEWRKLNQEKIRSASAIWHSKHPDAKKIISNNRRARTKTGGRLSVGLAEKLFKLQKGKCPCCGKPLGDNYHLDHKMPLALGGSNTDDNMQLLTAGCNMQKHTTHPIDFMQRRGFLL